ncbi:MAG: hypothetical protein IJ002_07360 [Clostridia bacterium]|nr:hypothetical protein [Clostridia bacterium]
MKSEKLQDAIGMVDEKLVESSAKKSKFKFKWTAAVAAVLVIALIAGVYLRAGAPLSLKAYAVAEAKYPEMAHYPENEMLPGFDDRYDAWREDRKRQREYYGAGENLDPFFEATISEFLASEESENLVYSPLNVYMALAMLAEITDGESREQILDLLGAANIETLRTEAHAVWNANYSDDGAVTSILASSLWLNEDVNFKEDTLETLSENYYASSYQGKMGSDKFGDAMKEWMNAQTGGLLRDYISEIEMTPETVMALVTTIYFRAKWENEFSESNNTNDVFHADSGDITCEFMNKTETYGSYYWGDKFAATSVSLENSGNMWFILPDEGVNVQELLTDSQALSFMCANGDWENCKSLQVNLSIPKFDVKSKLNLSDGLKNLGVTDCFDAGDADFSPLVSSGQPVWLGNVEHGARVAIDEEGVTAAAYTVMMLCGAAMPPEDEVDFTVDRPFIFVITGSDGLPLFVGVVNNPM